MADAAWAGSLFVDGAFVAPADGGTAAVVEKATGTELARVGVAGPDDVDRAVEAADRAQAGWAATPFDQRAALLRQVARAIEDRADDLADWVVRETGSIRGKAQYEVHGAAAELYEAAGLTSRATGEILPSADPGRLSLVQRVPVGVVGALTPWNFPLILGMRVLAPALALGNTVVLKTSPHTPVSGGLLVAELFAAAGAPAGVVNVLMGEKDAGEHLVAHPLVRMVHFTGSTDTGSVIAETAGRLLKKASMELGGNNALVVLDDADLDTASMVGAWSSYHYQGQTCITASRHIVLRSVAEEYQRRLAERAAAIVLGDPATDEVGLGPMISEAQRDRAHAILTSSVDAGARLIEGGTYDGLFYRPSVVADVRPGMELYDREIFAPVAPITVVDTEDEALRLVNDTRYGLVNGVLSGSMERGLAFAERVRSGMVHVNDTTCLDEAHVPFGGMGASGVGGRAGGEANLEEFTERRWIGIQRGTVHYPY